MAPKKPKRVTRISEKTANRAKKRVGPGRRFKPGETGNPKGRPPLPEDYKAFLNDKLGPKGLQALEAILDNPKHPRHEQAVEYVINRWKGTPTQRVEASGPGGGPIPVKAVMTSDEKRARMRQLAATAAQRVASGTPPPPAEGEDAGGSEPGESD